MLPSLFTLFFFTVIYTTWALQEANETQTLSNGTIVISVRLGYRSSSDLSYNGLSQKRIFGSPHDHDSQQRPGSASSYDGPSSTAESNVPKRVQNFIVLKVPWLARVKNEPIISGVFKVHSNDHKTTMLMKRWPIKKGGSLDPIQLEILHLATFHTTVVWAFEPTKPPYLPMSTWYDYVYIAVTVPDLHYVSARGTGLNAEQLATLRDEANKLVPAGEKR
jgi:hypothetical protein